MQRILILLVFMYSLSAEAQINAQFFVDGELSEKRTFPDSLKLNRYIQNLQFSWVNQGYFFSGIDSLSQEEDIAVFLHKGQKMNARLDGLKRKKLERYLSKSLESYADNGYPFASLQLDSVRQIGANTISAKTLVNTGPKITYDSAYFFQEVKTNHSYVYQLLDIVPENVFSEKSYDDISSKIDRVSFLSLARPTDLSFKQNRAIVFLDIEEEASSSFQGVIGLQQGSQGRAAAIGSIELDIQNLFRSGKQFQLSWESFAELSQELNIYYEHPFFLESRISPSFRFELLKQDTIFLTRLTGLGLNTYVSPKTRLFVEYERTVGSILSTDLETISASGLADFNRTSYSLEFSKGIASSLGRLKKGLVWRISTSAGRKKIDRNLSIPDTYYDTIQTESNFYRAEMNLVYQQPILKRQALFHSVKIGLLENDELLRNELYRLGGLRSLRGFNEKSIFARQYLLSRFEFRSFFEKNSYAYILYDQLIYQGSLQDQPFGIGLGFALATSAGQFSFALAVGNSEDQSISFSTMKAHFGYISRF